MKPLVVKLGGALLENQEALNRLFAAVADHAGLKSRPLVIVHGGGVLVEQQLARMSLKSEKIDGLRVTPFDQIPFVAGALAGTANKLLMAQMIAQGLKVVGLCLGDGGLLKVCQLDPRLGAVGVCQPGDPSLVNGLLSQAMVPVISPIAISDDGQLYNVNADLAATAIAQTLQAELLMLSDVAGILDGNGELISDLTPSGAQGLIDNGVIHGGMAVKVKASLDAAAQLGGYIDIAGWMDPNQLITLLDGGRTGTRISIHDERTV